MVLGIGNLVQSDDGFGVHIIRELLKEKETLPPHVDLLDAGTSLTSRLGDLAEADKIICVDVADGGETPGTVYRFRPEDVVYKKSKFHHAHKISLFDALDMVQCMTQKRPETVIIAVQPEDIQWGTSLSPTLQGRIPGVVDMVRREWEEDQEKQKI